VDVRDVGEGGGEIEGIGSAKGFMADAKDSATTRGEAKGEGFTPKPYTVQILRRRDQVLETAFSKNGDAGDTLPYGRLITCPGSESESESQDTDYVPERTRFARDEKEGIAALLYGCWEGLKGTATPSATPVCLFVYVCFCLWVVC